MKRAACLFLLLGLAGCPTTASSPEQSSGAEDEDLMFPDEREALEDARHPATDAVARGERELAAGHVQEAQAIFEAAVEENEGDARAQLDLGLALELQNRWDGAEEHYRAALVADPEFPEAMNNLGLLLRDRERTEEAVTVLERAVEIRPAFGEAWANLALAREELEELRPAREAYREAVRLMPQNANARTNLGMLLVRLGENEQAAIELHRAVPLARGDAATLLAVGNGLRRLGHAEGALRAMEAAVDAQRTPRMLAELALAQRAVGNAPGAIETLREAIAADADFATGHFLLGSLLAAQGEFAPAVTAFEAYLRLEPEGPHAARARQHLAAARARM